MHRVRVEAILVDLQVTSLPVLQVVPSRQDHGEVLGELIRPSLRDSRHDPVEKYPIAVRCEMEAYISIVSNFGQSPAATQS
jgi:hypothetical protein